MSLPSVEKANHLTAEYPPKKGSGSRNYVPLEIDDTAVREANLKKKQECRRKCITLFACTLMFLIIVGGFTFGVMLAGTNLIYNEYQCSGRTYSCDNGTVILYFELGIGNKYHLLPYYPNVNNCAKRCCEGEYFRNVNYGCRLDADKQTITSVTSVTKGEYSFMWFTFGLLVWVFAPLCLVGLYTGNVVYSNGRWFCGC